MTLRVLLIEDEPDIVLMVRLGLELHGYTVLEAGTGRAALDILAEETVDAILLDIRLPGINGWDVLRRIRENPPPGDPPVIMISAHSSPSSEVRAVEMGCAAYITKPFELSDLRSRLEEALSGRGN